MKSKICRKARALTGNLCSSLADVDSFCCATREFLSGQGLSSEIFPVELLLRESINNAIFHGNCGDCQKRIQVRVLLGRKWIRMLVADEGSGFNFRKAKKNIPDVDSVCERGMAIFSLYAHRISFNSTGNQVCLWRKRGQEQICE